jgi:hypothetical protein
VPISGGIDEVQGGTYRVCVKWSAILVISAEQVQQHGFRLIKMAMVCGICIVWFAELLSIRK